MRATALALLLLLPSPGRAQDRLALSWTAPAGCPDRDAVHAEVERLLGGRIPSDGAPVRAEGAAEAGPGDDFTLRLVTQVEDASGERRLESADCQELADAAALILALMIDPEAVVAVADAAADAERASAREVSEPTREDGELDPAVAVADVPPPLVSTRPASRLARPHAAEAVRATPPPAREAVVEEPEPPLAALLGLGGLLDLGSVPSVSGGAWVEGGITTPVVDGRLRATFVAPRPATLEDESAGADVLLVLLGARACGRPFEQARALSGCAGLDLGAVVGTGFGVSAPTTGAGLWMGATVGVALAWQPERWLDLEVALELVIPIVDQVFFVTLPRGDDDVFVPEDVAGRFGLVGHLHLF